MLTTIKTFKDNICTGIWIENNDHLIYIPFGLALALADSLTFDDKDSNPYDMIGYIEIFYEYSGDILLNDGSESVRIEKCEVKKFINELWSMV